MPAKECLTTIVDNWLAAPSNMEYWCQLSVLMIKLARCPAQAAAQQGPAWSLPYAVAGAGKQRVSTPGC